ncbi:MAG: hypothetical protein IJ733_09405 [Lachnospiraceae bacterium]|nr:hypothetical protein [Lachnospiraceae bacterium]
MTTKIVFSVMIGILLLGVCVWSYRMSNVDNTVDSRKSDGKEEGGEN